MTVDVNCGFCDKVFSVKPSRLNKTSNRLCCSVECAAKLKKSLLQPNCKCSSCGIDMYVKPSKLALVKNITCSRACAAEIKKTVFSGENNHQYGLKGETNPSFKSDIKVSAYGYVLIRDVNHPYSNCDGFVFLHRAIMEQHLQDCFDFDYLDEVNGRNVLSKNVIVHHKDGNKLNNVISNLEIMSLDEHSSLHYQPKERDCNTGRFEKTGKIKKGSLYRKYQFDAGQDVFASENIVIKPMESQLVSTDLFIEIPIGHVGLLWSRSGLSVKNKIEVGAGCIDCGYTGEVKVHLYNFGSHDFEVKTGDRIAQLLTIPVNLNNFEQVTELEESARGNGGFGHTGET